MYNLKLSVGLKLLAALYCLMILKPRNLREMDLMLREVPAEKRKVIVLVGRHPNEGTINIAQRHHGDWEKHSAVVVRIPGKWTPHAIWQKAARREESLREASLRADDAPTDIDIAKFLLKKGFSVPVVNFHASPDQRSMFRERQAMQYMLAKSSKIHEHRLFMKHALARPTNELVVEFFYSGNLIRNSGLKLFAINNPDSYARSGLEPNYLQHSRITKAALSKFSSEIALEFEEVLSHLSRTQLKRRAVVPKVFDPNDIP